MVKWNLKEQILKSCQNGLEFYEQNNTMNHVALPL
jgi:hypothetical protein